MAEQCLQIEVSHNTAVDYYSSSLIPLIARRRYYSICCRMSHAVRNVLPNKVIASISTCGCLVRSSPTRYKVLLSVFSTKRKIKTGNEVYIRNTGVMNALQGTESRMQRHNVNTVRKSLKTGRRSAKYYPECSAFESLDIKVATNKLQSDCRTYFARTSIESATT